MKRLLLPLLTLTLIVACGKDNKSGKKDSWTYTDPFLGNVSSVPGNVNTLLSSVTCYGSGYTNTNVSYQGRQQMQLPLTGFPTVVPAGDIYVGITSYGDIGVIRGNGSAAPTFIAYLCPRNFTTYQGSIISNVSIGSYTNCSFKPITATSLVFPGNLGSADFRMLDFGAYTGTGFTKLSVCR